MPSLQRYDYCKVAVDDSDFAKLDAYFDEVADRIEEHRLKGGKALVHCAAGAFHTDLVGCKRSSSSKIARLVYVSRELPANPEYRAVSVCTVVDVALHSVIQFYIALA